MFYVLHGEEEFLRSETIAKFKAEMGGAGWGDLNITVLDGRKLRWEELVNACSALPFLGDRRLIIVENLLQRFDKGETGPEAAGSSGEAEFAQKLAGYLPQLPPTTRLVFVEDRTLQRNNPILQLASRGAAGGYAREFAPLSEAQLPAWLSKRAQEKGAKIQRDAVALLLASAGADLRLLDQELEKLAAWVNYARPITAEDVRALVSATPQDNIFALVDALGLRQRESAMRQLQNLLAGDKNPLYILTMIARQFRLILATKDLAEEQKRTAKEIGQELQIKQSFIVDKLLRQSKHFALRELEAIQRRLLEMDQAIKTGRMEGQLALELFVVEVCRRRSR